MLDTPSGRTLVLAERGLREIGFTDGLLRRDYAFADFLAPSFRVRQVPLATFGQDPPSYRNACFGVLIGESHDDVAQYRALGAPQLLQIDDREVRRWKVTSVGDPQLLQRIAPDDLLRTIRERRAEWGPESILRARSIAFDATPVQLDFFDAELLPVIEAVVHTKLDRLLRETLTASKAVYTQRHLQPPNDAGLFRLIFRLLAAKLLADRRYPGEWTLTDPRDVVAAVERFYFHSGPAEPVLDDLPTQQAAWAKIRSAFHLQNVSVEALAYVYENTLVDQETRRLYGTHSTPREVAEYIVRHLPFEELPQEERRVFEPFAGHAALLIAAMGRLRTLLPNDTAPSDRHRYFVDMLAGLEIDEFAREVARLSLMLADYPNSDSWRLIGGDVFSAPELHRELSIARVVLCNPPFQDFKPEEREAYDGLLSTNKAADILLRVLRQPPDLLGFVLPRVFIDGLSFRRARQTIASTYGGVELVALPDVAFQHSGVETVLLIAHSKGCRPLSRRTGEVTKRDYSSFIRSGRPTREDAAILAAPSADGATAPMLWLYPLRRVWQALEGLPTLGDVARIRDGLYYRFRFTDPSVILVSREPRDGFVPGLVRVSDGFEPLFLRGHVFLNMDPQVMDRTHKSHLLDWDQPKVIVNAARLRRGLWAVTGVPDRTGLVVYCNFEGVWPTRNLPPEVLAAVLNGPVANAYMSTRRTSRHNRVATIEEIPVPEFSQDAVRTIAGLVEEYRRSRAAWLDRTFGASDHEYAEGCRRALIEIDAELLTAYDLPPRRERELLDYFTGYRRPGPVYFDHYYPEDFRPSLPWKMYVSGDLERAAARRTLERLPVLDDPVISAALAELD